MTTVTTAAHSTQDHVRAARAAQADWSARTVRDRLRHVRALRNLLATSCDALCDAVTADVNKPPEVTLGGDLLPLAAACRFLERHAQRLLRDRRIPSSDRPLWLWPQSDVVVHRPRGVVGVIGTWNYPLFLNGVQIVQALVAGNAVVWKPSEVAPASAAALADVFARAGFPTDLLHRMPATRAAGPELLEADIDYLVFTGGDAAGRAIARRLGERLIPSTLELSGCDALFVLDDADVDLAAQAAWFGATLNRGQTCLAVRRAFVHRSLYSAFCEKITTQAAAAPALRLALPSQVTQANELVANAVAAGARQYPPAGPPHSDDHLFTPTALFDATPEMAVCREAAFAPLFAVIPFDDLEQAIAWDRQCPFALGASIFTSNARRVEELARHLRAGAVTVNDVIAPTAHPATPFGGRGSSGWGITQGAEGLLEMTVPQVISRRGGRFRPHYDLAAGRSAVGQDRLLRGLLQASHSPTWSGRMSGWLNVFRNLKPSPVPSTADHSGTNSKPSTTVL